jgi:hypothetical protein
MNKATAVLTACLAVAILLTGGIACGKKKGTNPPPPGTTSSRTPFSDGAWQIDLSITATPGGSECDSLNSTSRDTFYVVAGEVQDEFFGVNCSFQTTGNNFTHTCRDTFILSDSCSIVITLTGSGTISGNTFTAVYTLTTTGLGNCSGSFFPLCTWRVTAAGVKVATIATAERAPSFPDMLERATKGKLLERISKRGR